MADRFASQGYSLKKKNKLGDQMITDLADQLFASAFGIGK